MSNRKVERMVGLAILTAIVVVLQLLGSFIKIGPVSITLVLIPIVVGAAVYGPLAGAYLGGVFAAVVLGQPDTSAFYQVSVVATVVTVLAKGILCGWVSGLAYGALARKHQWAAILVAAVLAPLVNTGVFFLGCRLFFWEALGQWGAGNAMKYLITVVIGVNFLGELAVNLVCSPVILRILRAVHHG